VFVFPPPLEIFFWGTVGFFFFRLFHLTKVRAAFPPPSSPDRGCFSPDFKGVDLWSPAVTTRWNLFTVPLYLFPLGMFFFCVLYELSFISSLTAPEPHMQSGEPRFIYPECPCVFLVWSLFPPFPPVKSRGDTQFQGFVGLPFKHSYFRSAPDHGCTPRFFFPVSFFDMWDGFPPWSSFLNGDALLPPALCGLTAPPPVYLDRILYFGSFSFCVRVVRWLFTSPSPLRFLLCVSPFLLLFSQVIVPPTMPP